MNPSGFGPLSNRTGLTPVSTTAAIPAAASTTHRPFVPIQLAPIPPWSGGQPANLPQNNAVLAAALPQAPHATTMNNVASATNNVGRSPVMQSMQRRPLPTPPGAGAPRLARTAPGSPAATTARPPLSAGARTAPLPTPPTPRAGASGPAGAAPRSPAATAAPPSRGGARTAPLPPLPAGAGAPRSAGTAPTAAGGAGLVGGARLAGVGAAAAAHAKPQARNPLLRFIAGVAGAVLALVGKIAALVGSLILAGLAAFVAVAGAPFYMFDDKSDFKAGEFISEAAKTGAWLGGGLFSKMAGPCLDIAFNTGDSEQLLDQFDESTTAVIGSIVGGVAGGVPVVIIPIICALAGAAVS